MPRRSVGRGVSSECLSPGLVHTPVGSKVRGGLGGRGLVPRWYGCCWEVLRLLPMGWVGKAEAGRLVNRFFGTWQ